MLLEVKLKAGDINNSCKVREWMLSMWLTVAPPSECAGMCVCVRAFSHHKGWLTALKGEEQWASGSV